MSLFPPPISKESLRLQRDTIRRTRDYGTRPALRRGLGGFAAGRRSWLGSVQTAGPNGEANYADHRYWVKLVRLNNTSSDLTDAATLAEVDEGDPGFFWTTVTNFAEEVVETHLLQAEDVIEVFVDYDLGHVVSGQKQREPRYWTNTTPSICPTLKITGHSTISGHPYQWLYSGIEQTLSMPSGVPTVENKSGAPTWTDLVINRPEIGNPTSAGVVLSTGGVDTTGADFPAGADVLPLPTGLILPFERIVIDGDAYYLVDFPNGIDGTCE